MAYLITGATGFIGRHLLAELVRRRDETVYVLVRESSRTRIEDLARRLETDRVVPVTGDLTEPCLGVDPGWVEQHRDEVTGFFHLAAIYDMSADEDTNQRLNVAGTQHALELAGALDVTCFHHVSSVAVAGDYEGTFDETMFDEGQYLPTPYHRTKFESERLVREQQDVPWRVYRPAVVVGHSGTGAMDKVDGPYYFFGALKRLRDAVPGWVPLVGLDLGDTNVVPVDYVAAALDHLAHLPDRDHETFHLVNPEPQPVVDLVNTWCAAAGAPRFATPLDRRLARTLPGRLVPRALRPSALVGTTIRTGAARAVLQQTTGRLGIPADVLVNATFRPVFSSRLTEEALRGSGIDVPDVESYARQLWDYWEAHLDPTVSRDRRARAALQGAHVVITGASSGIGQVVAHRVSQAGGTPVLVARSKEKLDDTCADIRATGGEAYAYSCDLSDLEAIDRLCEQLRADLPSVDAVVNNAGRSIRRSLRLSTDRFHDFERTMQLNYFGAIRLVMGLLPALEDGDGHVVNISSIGVQTNPPRFSAYVASKSALDSWSNVVASELVGSGVTFTAIHMPLVRTPMIAPTKLYDRFPAISPAQAADLVLRALVDRPHEINTLLGNAGAVAHTLVPQTSFRVLNLAYRVFPDSTAARRSVHSESDPDAGTAGTESEQQLLAQVFRGVHW